MTVHHPADLALHEYKAEGIVTSTERAAEDARVEMQRRAKKVAEEVRAAAELNAWRTRQEAAADAADHLANAKAIIDDYCAEQLVRISALSDQMLDYIETIEHRLRQIRGIDSEISELFIALGSAAEELARESRGRKAGFTEPAAQGNAQ